MAFMRRYRRFGNPFSWRLWTVWNGWRDGRKNLPAPEATAPSEPEQEVLSAGHYTQQDVTQYCQHKADVLKSALTGLQEEVAKTDGPEWERYQRLAGRSSVHVSLSPAFHLCLVFLLFLGEGAFNAVAFSILGVTKLETVLMAFALGTVILICAHIAGQWIRQWPEPKMVTAVKLLVLNAVVGGGLAKVNAIRIGYLEQMEKDSATAFVTNHPELTMAFLMLNLLMYVGAVVVTYLATDPIEGFAKAKEKYERKNAKIRMIEGRINQLDTILQTETERIKAAVWQWTAYYRKINRRCRTAAAPRYFDDEHAKHHMPELPPVTGIRYADAHQAHAVPVGLNVRPADNSTVHKPSMNGRASMSSMWLLLAVLCSATVSACQSAPQAKMLVVFADVSASVRDFTTYREGWEKIRHSLKEGDRVVLARIGAETFTQFRPVVDEELPRMNMLTDNVLAHTHKLKLIDAKLSHAFDEVLIGPRSPKTDIFNALTLAEKLCHDPERQCVVVLLSDMLEDAEVNFERLPILTDDFTQRIIEDHKQKGQLPNLAGVKMYIAGASAGSAKKALAVERFWLAYCKAANADLQPQNYGPTLMNFAIASSSA